MESIVIVCSVADVGDVPLIVAIESGGSSLLVVQEW
jgi:hypothetical protein